ncbi:MAG: TIGR00730 family Rossman fold protein, partial [bacterium]
MKRVCVFCGSNAGGRPEYGEAAFALGGLLAGRGLGLVYGGGNVGLMGLVADGALAGGGEVIGVIPERLKEKEPAHLGATDMHVVDSLSERKQLMADRADGFISLPGGMGTLDEMFEMLI